MTSNMTEIEAVDGGHFSAYVAEPSAGQGPGLVVIQEIFGIDQNMKETAEAFARAGFVACVPDLFWRLEPDIVLDSSSDEGRAQGMAYNQKLDQNSAIQDLDATVQHLRQRTGKVGAVGFCLGGRLAYLLSARTDIDAAVGYYGVGIDAVLDEAKSIDTPLMLHIAQEDPLCSPEAQQKISQTLENIAGVSVHIYEAAGHAFARLNSAAYIEEAAKLANSRTLAFFKQHLAT